MCATCQTLPGGQAYLGIFAHNEFVHHVKYFYVVKRNSEDPQLNGNTIIQRLSTIRCPIIARNCTFLDRTNICILIVAHTGISRK